jgi:hypothetical protein
MYKTRCQHSKTIFLQRYRPKLSAYISVLYNIGKKLDPDNESIDWFNANNQEIMSFLEIKTPQTKKISLSALFV